MKSLNGNIALVTGASRGIGKGIALAFGEAQPAFTLQCGNCISIRCDHSHDEEVKSVFEKIQTEQGPLDILVNNSSGSHRKRIWLSRY